MRKEKSFLVNIKCRLWLPRWASVISFYRLISRNNIPRNDATDQSDASIPQSCVIIFDKCHIKFSLLLGTNLAPFIWLCSCTHTHLILQIYLFLDPHCSVHLPPPFREANHVLEDTQTHALNNLDVILFHLLYIVIFFLSQIGLPNSFFYEGLFFALLYVLPACNYTSSGARYLQYHHKQSQEPFSTRLSNWFPIM